MPVGGLRESSSVGRAAGCKGRLRSSFSGCAGKERCSKLSRRAYGMHADQDPIKKGRMEMRILKSVMAVVCALMTVAVFATATPANSQVPAYLNALSNLRAARANIQMDNRPTFRVHLKIATDEISNAITDLKVAVKQEGANPYQTPPPQSGGDPNAPVHQALKLLHDARSNIEHEAEIDRAR